MEEEFEEEFEEIETLKVDYIKGELYLSNGEKVSFTLSEDGFSQWGLDKEKLGFTQPILEALSQTFAEQIYEMEEYYREYNDTSCEY
ncbi:MAG: hypothetical protein LBR36_01270 [Bacteroidales bacterium]|jgi:hypothetical protein|nr:hypothetical protein [Bacteroidales bacterium]